MDWSAFDRPALRCRACGLWRHSQVHILNGEGPIPASVALIGEGPGRVEEEQDRNFVGRAGELLTSCLNEAGLLRSECWIANTVRCRPKHPLTGRDRKPTMHEIDCCRGYLVDEMRRVQPRVIVALGDVAAASLLSKRFGGVLEARGRVTWSEEFNAWIVQTIHPAFVIRQYSQREFLVDDLRLAKQVAETGAPPEPGPPTVIEVVRTLDHAYAVRDALLAADRFHFDWETNGLHLTKSIGFCISFATRPGHAYVIPRFLQDWQPAWSDDDLRALDQDVLIPVLQSDVPKGGFHVAFDNNISRTTLGVWPRHVVFCGMIANHVLNNHLGRGAHGLKVCAARYTTMGRYDDALDSWLVEHGYVKEGKADRDHMWRVPDDLLHFYSGADADASLRLEDVYTPLLIDDGLMRVFQRERMPLALEHQETDREGLRINVPYLDRLSGDLARTLDRIEHDVSQLAGREINVASAKQLATWLFDELDLPILARTDTGQPSTAEEVLLQLKDMHPSIELILQHRALAKIKGTWIDGRKSDGARRALRAALDDDGYARMNTLLHGTDTFRFVTRKPFPVHTFPKKVPGMPSVRALIIPDDGYRFVEADHVQQEWALQAILAGQEDMVEAVLDRGEDVHEMVARDLGGVAREKFQGADGRWLSPDHEAEFKQQRTRFKSINFMILFRGGARKLARMALGCRCVQGRDVCEHEAEASVYLSTYYERYDRIRWWQYAVIKELRRTGFVRERFGTRRKLPGIFDPDRYTQFEAERQGCNFPIQRGGNAVLARAYLRLRREFRGDPPLRAPFPARVCFTVHDSLISQVRTDVLDEGIYRIRRAMEQPHAELGGRSLRSDIVVTDCWGG